MREGPNTKMEELITSQAAEGFTPVLEKSKHFLEIETCPSCSTKTMVRLSRDGQERFACPCGHFEDEEAYEEIDDFSDMHEPRSADDRYDVPPGYMDDCPEGVDPDSWADYYTGD